MFILFFLRPGWLCFSLTSGWRSVSACCRRAHVALEQLEDSNRGTDPPPLSHSANETNSATFRADKQLQNLLGKTDEARPPVPRAGPLEPPGIIDQNVWEPLQLGKCDIGGDIHIHNKGRFSCWHQCCQFSFVGINAVTVVGINAVTVVGINSRRSCRYQCR